MFAVTAERLFSGFIQKLIDESEVKDESEIRTEEKEESHYGRFNDCISRGGHSRRGRSFGWDFGPGQGGLSLEERVLLDR